MLEISSAAKRLAGYQEGLSSMELIKLVVLIENYLAIPYCAY
jgi:hypothetical protein